MIDRDDLIKAAGKLRPLPESAVRLAHLVADDFPDIAEITRVVEFDPVLAGTVIRVANSAAYRGRMDVGSVKDAVSRLGTSAILAMAVRAAVRSSFDRPMPEYGLGVGRFWAHSSAASLAAEAARRFCDAPVPSDASTSALLHDIGKLVIAPFLLPRKLPAIVDAMATHGLSLPEAEREIIGMDHAELGGIIVEGWKVPETVHLGVAHHHDLTAGLHPICYVVHLANLVAEAILADGVEQESDVQAPQLHPAVLDTLKLREQDVLALTRQVRATFKELEESYSAAGAAQTT